MNLFLKVSLISLLVFSIVSVTSSKKHTSNGAYQLTIAIANAGDKDGSYTLNCHPTGGNHPRASKACSQLDFATSKGADPFKPTPSNNICTEIYGGPQEAHVEGLWAGNMIMADFNRKNGCEITRWNKLNELFLSPRY